MKRKFPALITLIALLLGVCLVVGSLSACELNAMLEKYLETLPETTRDTLPVPEDTQTPSDIPRETDILLDNETGADAPVESLPADTLPEEIPPDPPKPLETSSDVPAPVPIENILYAPNLDGAAGQYATDADNFRPVGQVKIEWMPDAMDHLNIKDGKFSDWEALGLKPTVITPDNMISWSVHNTPEGWQTEAYFLADADFLYVGLRVVDPIVVACSPDDIANYGTGDAFQIQIDFGRTLTAIVENDPDTAHVLPHTQCIFYSFAFNGDGGPVAIQVQSSDNDRLLTDDDGVLGATGRTDDGWCAEFTIPWEELYNDHRYRYFFDQNNPFITISPTEPLSLGMSLYYLDKIGEDGVGDLSWAAGTLTGFTGSDENGRMLDPSATPPVVRWDVYDMGMYVYLPWRNDLSFTCNGLVVSDD